MTSAFWKRRAEKAMKVPVDIEPDRVWLAVLTGLIARGVTAPHVLAMTNSITADLLQQIEESLQ